MKPCNRCTLPLTLALLAGCSMLPYENEFSCSRTDQYGKCLNLEKAYQESVTGQSQGEPMVPASKQTSKQKKSNGQTHPEAPAAPTTALLPKPLSDYQSARYRTLTDLLQQPKKPMLRPPVTVRTLILSYSDRDRKQRLYLPRYVYSILEDPQWLMGTYLDQAPDDGLVMPTFQKTLPESGQR